MYDSMSQSHFKQFKEFKFPNNAEFLKMRRASFKNFDFSDKLNPEEQEKLQFEAYWERENLYRKLNVSHFVIWDKIYLELGIKEEQVYETIKKIESQSAFDMSPYSSEFQNSFRQRYNISSFKENNSAQITQPTHH